MTRHDLKIDGAVGEAAGKLLTIPRSSRSGGRRLVDFRAGMAQAMAPAHCASSGTRLHTPIRSPAFLLVLALISKEPCPVYLPIPGTRRGLL